MSYLIACQRLNTLWMIWNISPLNMAVSLIIKVCLGWYPRHYFESASRFFFRLWVQLLLSLVLRLMVRHLVKLGESRYIFYNAWWPIVLSVPFMLHFQHWYENSFRARLLAFVFASLSSWRTQRVIVLTSLYSILFYLHLNTNTADRSQLVVLNHHRTHVHHSTEFQKMYQMR